MENTATKTRNSLSLALAYDNDGQMTDIDTAGGSATVQDLHLTYDAAGNITAVNDNIASSRNEALSYDVVNRLTNATGAYGNIDFGYDLVGNRTLRRINGTGGMTETYTYPGSSNRLSSVSDGTNTRSFTYSTAGNVTGDDPPGSLNYALAYNDNNRLTGVTQSGTQLASYAYDADEHRILKQVFGSGGYTHHYQYDQDGHLIAESDATGTVIREYLWLGALPIAVVDSGTLYFIHTDYRGAPQKATDSSKAIVWDAQIQPFGEVYGGSRVNGTRQINIPWLAMASLMKPVRV